MVDREFQFSICESLDLGKWVLLDSTQQQSSDTGHPTLSDLCPSGNRRTEKIANRVLPDKQTHAKL